MQSNARKWRKSKELQDNALKYNEILGNAITWDGMRENAMDMRENAMQCEEIQ